MSLNADRDPREWIIEQDLLGRSQEEIAAELSERVEEISQPTISRYLEAAQEGKPSRSKAERIILNLFALEKAEDARVEADQENFLEFMDALQEWKEASDFDDAQAILKVRQKEAAERVFELRQEDARAACKVVIDLLKSLGFMAPEQRYIWGDGLEFFNAGISDFSYATEGAKIVGFAEADFLFRNGLTAEEMRKGITATQRMEPSAVLAGEPRPRMLGLRDAFEIPTHPYPDLEWFFGEYYSKIARWYELRDQRPDGWTEEGTPHRLEGSDLEWYQEVLELEMELMAGGFTFEDSILGWSLDWRSEVNQKRSVLQALKWRLVRSEASSAVLGTAGWAAGVTAALIVFVIAVIPFLGEFFRGIGWVLKGAWHYSIGAYQNSFHDYEIIGEWFWDAILAMITSPVAFFTFLVISVLLLCATTGFATTRTRSRNYLWSLGMLTVFTLLTVVTGIGSVVKAILS